MDYYTISFILGMNVFFIELYLRSRKKNKISSFTGRSLGIIQKYLLPVINLVNKIASNSKLNPYLDNLGLFDPKEKALFIINVTFIFILSSFIVLYFLGVLWGVFYFLIFYGATKIYIRRKRKKLIKEARVNFVYVLDLVVSGVQAGMVPTAVLLNISGSLNTFSKFLAHAINEFNTSVRYGNLDDACNNLYKFLPIKEVEDFNNILANSSQYGSKLSTALREQANDLRNEYMSECEESIGKIKAFMTVPMVLFMVFPVLVILIAPEIIRVFDLFANDKNGFL